MAAQIDLDIPEYFEGRIDIWHARIPFQLIRMYSKNMSEIYFKYIYIYCIRNIWVHRPNFISLLAVILVCKY